MTNDQQHRFYVPELLSEHIGKTDEGYLICFSVPVARTGEYIYRASEVPVPADESGMVKIIRKEEEIFNEDAINSFTGKSLTINHPPEFVAPENWKEYTCGILQNVRRGEGDQKDFLIADILITDQSAI